MVTADGLSLLSRQKNMSSSFPAFRTSCCVPVDLGKYCHPYFLSHTYWHPPFVWSQESLPNLSLSHRQLQTLGAAYQRTARPHAQQCQGFWTEGLLLYCGQPYLILVASISSGASVKYFDWGEFFINENNSCQECLEWCCTQCVIFHIVCNYTHCV